MTVEALKQYIYDNHKIEYILNSIGCGHIVYHPNKDYYSCSNINGDNTGAINIQNNRYLNCRNYTRDLGDNADLITLVQYNKSLDGKRCSFWDALKYLHKLLGLPLSVKDRKPQKQEKTKDLLAVFKKVVKRRERLNVADLTILPETELSDFIPHIHIDWFREGIIKKTIDKFGLAYSYRYKRNVIPLRYWMTGELLGFNMRTSVENYEMFGIKKYYITPGYNKQMNVYGLWENKESIQRAKTVIVYEAEKSVLKRDSLGDGRSVAVSGHIISDEQVRILIGLNCEVVIAFDKDIDRNQIRHCCEKFYGIRKISYIWDKWDLLGDKDAPADAPDKVFQFLFKHRVDYDEKEHTLYLQNLAR